MVCSSADQFVENLLVTSGADVKRSKLEGRNGILTWKWTLEYLDHLRLHVQMKECRQRWHGENFPQYLHLHLRQKNTCLKCEVKECTRKHSGSVLSGQKSVRTPGCPACETPGLVKSHTRECKTYQDAWDESRRSTDPNPKRSKTTSVTDNENLADQMDEDNFRRGPATSAQVARNVLHIRGEDSTKFDVNEEAWPNADLVIRSSYAGALIDGLPADKVKAGDEREIKQMKDLQVYSWVKETNIPPDKSILLTSWARRSEEFRDDSER